MQDGSHLHSPGLPKVNMPPVRADLIAKLVNAQAARLDKNCGVDAQSKSVFEDEDEREASILQTELSLLEQRVEAGRMKNSLSREDIAQNERNALFTHTLYYDQLHSLAATDGAATSSVPGYCQHSSLESDDADDESNDEDTISISSMDACCSSTSESIGSDIDKQWLLNGSRIHGELPYTPARLDFPRSQMPLTEVCPVCQIEDSDEISAMTTPCCGRFIHEICNDEELEKTGKCWSCEKEQNSSSLSKAWTCSRADEYIVHFAVNPERIRKDSSSPSCNTTPEQYPSLASWSFGGTESSDLDAFDDINAYSYTPCYLEPEENKALDDLEALKDYFLALWKEVADNVTEKERVRIIQEVVTGTKVPVDFHTTNPMVPSPAIGFQPPDDFESVTIHENQSLQERSHALSRLRTSLESAMDAMRTLV